MVTALTPAFYGLPRKFAATLSLGVFRVNATGAPRTSAQLTSRALHSCSFVSIRGGMNAQFPDEETKSGEFKRQEDAFREWISNDGSSPYAAEAGRYHLYVSLACPWASRTVILRKLKGLED